ncbi:hypothetical protein [Halostagnicola larsenii]|uniref:hypothetical protein n=1 Tax=Halostagnicola larsenii TaxID=353800 RepID=UPI0012FA7491|nr:hypothetical protein [Halostagnicola larsenii]
MDVLDSSSRIGWVGVNNYDTESHRFSVQVERDGSIVHESSHTIRGSEDNVIPGEAVDCTWGDAAGTHRIRARVDGNEWVEQSVDEAIDGSVDCVTARVNYGNLRSVALDIFIRENCDAVPEYNGGCAFANE